MGPLARRRATDDAGTGHARRGTAAAPEASEPAPAVGSYLTDGRRLLRVAHTLPCVGGGGRFLALEDCRTLELVLCRASALATRRLRPVVPSG